ACAEWSRSPLACLSFAGLEWPALFVDAAGDAMDLCPAGTDAATDDGGYGLGVGRVVIRVGAGYGSGGGGLAGRANQEVLDTAAALVDDGDRVLLTPVGDATRTERPFQRDLVGKHALREGGHDWYGGRLLRPGAPRLGRCGGLGRDEFRRC